MDVKPFDFRGLTKENNRFVYPEWYKRSWLPDAQAMEYWRTQYDLAKKGEDHEEPDYTMRSSSAGGTI